MSLAKATPAQRLELVRQIVNSCKLVEVAVMTGAVLAYDSEVTTELAKLEAAMAAVKAAV
jgi:hypothetical protein